MLRHTSAIPHLCHGMDVPSLQRLLGRESLEVVRRRLTALDAEDMERTAGQTSPAGNWQL
jgi:site-specific recombinase XerD